MSKIKKRTVKAAVRRAIRIEEHAKKKIYGDIGKVVKFTGPYESKGTSIIIGKTWTVKFSAEWPSILILTQHGDLTRIKVANIWKSHQGSTIPTSFKVNYEVLL